MKTTYKYFIILFSLLIVSCNNKENSEQSGSNSDDDISNENRNYLTFVKNFEIPTSYQLDYGDISMDSGKLNITAIRDVISLAENDFETIIIDTASGSIIERFDGSTANEIFGSISEGVDRDQGILTKTELVRINDSILVSYIVKGKTAYKEIPVNNNNTEVVYVQGVPVEVERNQVPHYRTVLNTDSSKYIGEIQFYKYSSETMEIHTMKNYAYSLNRFYDNPMSSDIDNMRYHDGYVAIATHDDTLRVYNYQGNELLKLGNNDSRDKMFSYYNFCYNHDFIYVMHVMNDKNVEIAKFDTKKGDLLKLAKTGLIADKTTGTSSFNLIDCDSILIVSLYTSVFWIDKATLAVLRKIDLKDIGAIPDDVFINDEAPIVYKGIIIKPYLTRTSGDVPTEYMAVIRIADGKILQTIQDSPFKNSFGLRIVDGSLYFFGRAAGSFSNPLNNLRRYNINY